MWEPIKDYPDILVPFIRISALDKANFDLLDKKLLILKSKKYFFL